jgi:hypothetical protein
MMSNMTFGLRHAKMEQVSAVVTTFAISRGVTWILALALMKTSKRVIISVM